MPMPPPKAIDRGAARPPGVPRDGADRARARGSRTAAPPRTSARLVGARLLGGRPLRPGARLRRQRRPGPPHRRGHGQPRPAEPLPLASPGARPAATTCTPRRTARTAALVVFCHGLFGQGRNWTQIAKQLAVDHRALLVDMPDHGRSAWTERFDYVGAADRVAGLLVGRRPRRAGRPLDGRQDRDAGGAAPPRAGRAAVRGRRRRRWPTATPTSSAATSTRCRRLDLAALERRGDADDAAARGGARRRPSGRSCCRTSAATGTAGPGSSTSTSSAATSRRCGGWPEDAAGRHRAVRRAGAVGRGAESALRQDELRRRRWTGGSRRNRRVTDQGRRALGPLRAARGVRRGAAPVPALRRLTRALAGAVGRHGVAVAARRRAVAA